MEVALTLTKVLTLAAVDAVNPCTLAVQTLMLIAIMTSNPRQRRKVLTAGLAFAFTIYLVYFLYGVIIVKGFEAIHRILQDLSGYVYRGLGIAAILLGFLQIYDYISYSPGRPLTEMPLRFRPRVKRMLKGISDEKTAVAVAIFCAVFLLPCTIGPYIIMGGILSFMGILAAIPWLLLYDLIFILPMLGITIAIYAGLTAAGRVMGWREKNIARLHLIAGILLIGIGAAIALNLL